MRITHFLSLFIFILSFNLKAQDSIIIQKNENVQVIDTSLSPVSFDTKRIEKYKSSKDFEYLKNAESDSWWVRFKRWLQLKYNQFENWFFDQFGTSSLVGLILTILPYFLLVGLLLLIIWLFSKFNPSSTFLKSDKNPDVLLNEEEQLVKSENIEDLIAFAVQNQDYRLAVRYYYLLLLKLLNQKGIIHYEFQKTNAEYLAEIEKLDFKESLKRSMRIYDFIWYGSFSINKQEFENAEVTFKQLQNNLKSLPDE